MLQALVAYAQEQELISQRGYTPKVVRWAVDLGADGRFLGLVPLGSTDSPRNSGIRFNRAPDLAQNELIAGGVTRSHFLIDTLAVVIPWSVPEDSKTAAKHAFFLQLLDGATDVLPSLAVAVQFFRDPEHSQQLLEAAQQQNARPVDKATIRIAGRFPVEDPGWYPWWDAFRARLSGANETYGVCLVTGQSGPITKTHPKVGGLSAVGGASTGSVLVSFDKPAFSSYGLEQGANAPMLEHAAVGYAQALEHLIADAPRFGDIKVLHWFKERIPEEADPFAFLQIPEERVEQEALLESSRTLWAIRRGTDLAPPSINRFYAVLVSAVSARIMIRGWYEGTYESLQRNVAQWFSDLAIVGAEGSMAKNPAFWRVLSDLTIEKRDMPAPLMKSLWEAAVLARPIPRLAAQMALARIRQAMFGIGQNPVFGYGVLKAFLLRQHQQEGQTMSSSLDTERPEAAYHAGRLLAIMGRLQNAANPGVNADIITRFYNAASSNPALTFGRLASLARFHLNKLDSGGLRFWFEGEIAQVMERIHNFPTTMGLSEQSLFALGYYHQLAHYRKQAVERVEKDEHPESI